MRQRLQESLSLNCSRCRSWGRCLVTHCQRLLTRILLLAILKIAFVPCCRDNWLYTWADSGIDRAFGCEKDWGLDCSELAIGAVLWCNLAAHAKYFPNVEIIELYHDKQRKCTEWNSDQDSWVIPRSAKIQHGAVDGRSADAWARGADFKGMHPFGSIAWPSGLTKRWFCSQGEGLTRQVIPMIVFPSWQE